MILKLEAQGCCQTSIKDVTLHFINLLDMRGTQKQQMEEGHRGGAVNDSEKQYLDIS